MKSSPGFLIAAMAGVSLLLCTISFTGIAQLKKTGIHFFEGSWKDAVAKAKQENKSLFFDAYASWCGPCKAMDAKVYTDAKVAAFFNRKFICFRVDMEKGEGPELVKRFPSIDGYPSLLFLANDGHIIKTVLGSRSAGVLLQEAKLALVN
jgi:thioredoxin 1